VEELATLSPAFVGGAALAFGLVVGSFLNVVVHRLPEGESVVRPGSRCPSCRQAIAPWDNVPVLSFIWLRGRCRGCGIQISWRYPAFELLTGVVFAAIALRYGFTLATPIWLVFAAILLATAAIDFDHQIIPDELSLGGLAVGLLAMPLLAVAGGGAAWPALREAALGAFLGGGSLWLIGFVHARICVALGRSFEHWPGEGEALPSLGSLDYWTWFPGLGFGDVKLLAMIGAFVGVVGVVHTILAASLAGLVMGLAVMAIRRSSDSPFGFAPAIALGALLVVLFPGVSLS
jgi:leader peptidase (prepilin peptidase)/N-methyltransferase